MDLLPEDIAFIVVTALLSFTSITTNSLLLSVIVAAEKVGSNVANLVFLCIPHLELAVLALINRYLVYGQYELKNDGDGKANVTLPVECLERGAILWSIGGITSLTIFQYLHIEKPFWFEAHVTTKSLVISSLIGGCISHLVGLVPIMSSMAMLTAYAIFAALVFISLFLIIGLCVRMLMLAEQHRRRIRLYTASVKTSRADSMRFLLILITIYIVSNIVPVVIGLAELANMPVPSVYMTVLHLIAPICYPILYGTRTSQGFLTSIRMAICCCLPVKHVESEPQIDDMVRLTMMRLGNVMIKIDEQAAIRRHSSYLKRRSRIIKSFPFLRSSEREHETARPYNSCAPRLGRFGEDFEVKEQALRAVSLHTTSIDKVPRHAKVGRLFSWLPKRSARKLDLTQKASNTDVDDKRKSDSSNVTLMAASGPTRKLSNISEQPDNIEEVSDQKLDNEQTNVKTAGEDLSIPVDNVQNSLEVDNYSTHSSSPCLQRM